MGLYFYHNHFCLIGNLQVVSFNQAIQDLETKFKMVDDYITQENVDAHFK